MGADVGVGVGIEGKGGTGVGVSARGGVGVSEGSDVGAGTASGVAAPSTAPPSGITSGPQANSATNRRLGRTAIAKKVLKRPTVNVLPTPHHD